MKSVVVFCGSSEGSRPVYAKLGRELGAFLAKRNIRVVYGGSQTGIMGAVADGALENGGEVVGVLPTFLTTREVAHPGITQMITVESMHERKLKMHQLSDGIIALPGGFGTFEELFEMLTWAQLGLHHHPIGLLNVDGYYDHLVAMIDHMNKEGFLRDPFQKMLLSDSLIAGLIGQMENYKIIPGIIQMRADQT